MGCDESVAFTSANEEGYVMDAKKQTYQLICHRCEGPMGLHSQEIVDGNTVEIFRCEQCDTLEAMKVERAA